MCLHIFCLCWILTSSLHTSITWSITSQYFFLKCHAVGRNRIDSAARQQACRRTQQRTRRAGGAPPRRAWVSCERLISHSTAPRWGVEIPGLFIPSSDGCCWGRCSGGGWRMSISAMGMTDRLLTFHFFWVRFGTYQGRAMDCLCYYSLNFWCITILPQVASFLFFSPSFFFSFLLYDTEQRYPQ